MYRSVKLKDETYRKLIRIMAALEAEGESSSISEAVEAAICKRSPKEIADGWLSLRSQKSSEVVAP